MTKSMRRNLITAAMVAVVLTGLAYFNRREHTREEALRAEAAAAAANAESAAAAATEANIALNRQAGEAFLAARAQEADVVKLPSGLMYRVLREGTGRSPGRYGPVQVHYEGRYISGNVFDSSYATGQPAIIHVERVIKGWTEALQLMQEGAKWQLYIPHRLAYGTEGAEPKIPPYSAIVFDVELLRVLE